MRNELTDLRARLQNQRETCDELRAENARLRGVLSIVREEIEFLDLLVPEIRIEGHDNYWPVRDKLLGLIDIALKRE